MPQEAFEVGERVRLIPSQHLGTIVHVRLETPPDAPNALAVRRYDIKLDDGGTIRGVYHGIQRAGNGGQ